jgi:hypothetical protein
MARISDDIVRQRRWHAGDMAWTWGEAAWRGAGAAARTGHYVRLRRKRPDGWKLVFAQLIAAPPVPAPVG